MTTRTIDRIISPPLDDTAHIEWVARVGWFRDLVAQIEDVHGEARVRILEPRLPKLARITCVWFLPRREPAFDRLTKQPLPGLVNTGLGIDLIPGVFRAWGENSEFTTRRGGINPVRLRMEAVNLGLLA